MKEILRHSILMHPTPSELGHNLVELTSQGRKYVRKAAPGAAIHEDVQFSTSQYADGRPAYCAMIIWYLTEEV